MRIPILRNALAAARRARLVLTIPGTKTIELAALGKPVDRDDAAQCARAGDDQWAADLSRAHSGDRSAAQTRRRGCGLAAICFHTQPNMDAGRELIRELHGTLTPGRVARVALEAYDDATWLARSSAALAELYRVHVGASERMAEALLRLAA